MRKCYVITDLGAELWPCENCGHIGILALSLCDECRKINGDEETEDVDRNGN